MSRNKKKSDNLRFFLCKLSGTCEYSKVCPFAEPFQVETEENSLDFGECQALHKAIPCGPTTQRPQI